MALLDETADGVYVIAVTPFTETGALDLDSTDRMVDFYLEKGATGLTVLGMMGEAPKLTAEESRIFVRRVLKRVDGRVPVVAGVSAADIMSRSPITVTPDHRMSDVVDLLTDTLLSHLAYEERELLHPLARHGMTR